MPCFCYFTYLAFIAAGCITIGAGALAYVVAKLKKGDK